MTTQSFLSNSSSSRSTTQIVSVVTAVLVGIILLSYAVYFVPNKFADYASVMGYLVFLAAVGLLSIIGGIGYWRNKPWGWYIHLVSTLGQIILPGSLFEFKLDLYHLIGWVSPAVSLAVVVLMGVSIRRKKRSSQSKGDLRV